MSFEEGHDYIQGWLKGVNSSSVDPASDMGNDGLVNSPNSIIARDVVGFGLHYFDNGIDLDYKSVSVLVLLPNFMELQIEITK